MSAKRPQQRLILSNRAPEDDGLSFALDALNSIEKRSPDAHHNDGALASPSLDGIAISSTSAEEVPFSSPNSNVKLMIIKLRTMREHKSGGNVVHKFGTSSAFTSHLPTAAGSVAPEGEASVIKSPESRSNKFQSGYVNEANSLSIKLSDGSQSFTNGASNNTPKSASEMKVGRLDTVSTINSDFSSVDGDSNTRPTSFSSTKKRISFALSTSFSDSDTSPEHHLSASSNPYLHSNSISSDPVRRLGGGYFSPSPNKLTSQISPNLVYRKQIEDDFTGPATPKVFKPSSEAVVNSLSSKVNVETSNGSVNSGNRSISGSRTEDYGDANESRRVHDSGNRNIHNKSRDDIFSSSSSYPPSNNKSYMTTDMFLDLDETNFGAASAMKILFYIRAYLASPEISAIVNNSARYGQSNYARSLALLLYNHLVDREIATNRTGNNSGNTWSSRISSPQVDIDKDHPVSSRILDGSYSNFYATWLHNHLKALARIISLNDIFNQWCSYSGTSRKSSGDVLGSYNFSLSDLKKQSYFDNGSSGGDKVNSGDNLTYDSDRKRYDSNYNRVDGNDIFESVGDSHISNTSGCDEESDDDREGDIIIGGDNWDKRHRRVGFDSPTESLSLKHFERSQNANKSINSHSPSMSLVHVPLIVDGIDTLHMKFLVRSCLMKFQELVLIKKRNNKRFINICLKMCYNSQYLGKSSKSAKSPSQVPKLSLRKLFLAIQPKLLYVVNHSNLKIGPPVSSSSSPFNKSPSRLDLRIRASPGLSAKHANVTEFYVTREELVIKIHLLRCFRRFYHRIIYRKRFRDVLILHRLFITKHTFSIMKKCMNNHVIVDKHLCLKADAHFEASKFRQVRMVSLLRRWRKNFDLSKRALVHYKKLRLNYKRIAFPLQCIYRPCLVRCFMAIKEQYIEQMKGREYSGEAMKQFDDYHYKKLIRHAIRRWRYRNAMRFWQVAKSHLVIANEEGSIADKNWLLSLNSTPVVPRLESNFNILFWKIVINCWNGTNSSSSSSGSGGDVSSGGKKWSLPGLDTVSSIKMGELRYKCCVEDIFAKFNHLSQLSYSFERISTMSQNEYPTIYFTKSNVVLDYRRKIVARYGEVSSLLYYANDKSSCSIKVSAGVGCDTENISGGRKPSTVSNVQLAQLDNFSCVRLIKVFKKRKLSEESSDGDYIDEIDDVDSDNREFSNFYSSLTRRFSSNSAAKAKIPSRITTRSDQLDLKYDFSTSYSGQMQERNTFYLTKKSKPLFVLTYSITGLDLVPVSKLNFQSSSQGICSSAAASSSSSSSASKLKSPYNGKGNKNAFNKSEIFVPFIWQITPEATSGESSALSGDRNSPNQPRYFAYSQTRLMVALRVFMKNCKKLMTTRAAFAKVSKNTGLKLQKITFFMWLAYYKLEIVMRRFRMRNVVFRLKEQTLLHRRLLIGMNKSIKLSTATMLGRSFHQLHISLAKSSRLSYKIAASTSGFLDEVGGLDGMLEYVKFMLFSYLFTLVQSKGSKGDAAGRGTRVSSASLTSSSSSSLSMSMNASISARVLCRYLTDKASHNNKGYKKGFLYKCFISQYKFGFKSLLSQKKFLNLESFYDSAINKAYYNCILRSNSASAAAGAGVSPATVESNSNVNSKYLSADSSLRPKWLGIAWKRRLYNEVLEMMSVRRTVSSCFQKFMIKLRVKQQTRRANEISSTNKQRDFIGRLKGLAKRNAERRKLNDNYKLLILKKTKVAFEAWRFAKVARRSDVLLVHRCFRYLRHGSKFVRACKIKMALLGDQVDVKFQLWKTKTFNLKRNSSLITSKSNSLILRFCLSEMKMLRMSLLALRKHNFMKFISKWRAYVWSEAYLQMKERKSASADSVFVKKSKVLKKKQQEFNSRRKKQRSLIDRVRQPTLFEEDEDCDRKMDILASKDVLYYSLNSITFFCIRNRNLLIHRMKRMFKSGWMKFVTLRKKYNFGGSFDVFDSLEGGNDVQPLHPRAKLLKLRLAFRILLRRLRKLVSKDSNNYINSSISDSSCEKSDVTKSLSRQSLSTVQVPSVPNRPDRARSSMPIPTPTPISIMYEEKWISLSAYRELENKRIQRLRSIILFRTFRRRIKESISKRLGSCEFRNSIIALGKRSTCKRIFGLFLERTRFKKKEAWLANSFIFRRSCSLALKSLSRARSNARATRELNLFSDICRIRFVASRAIRIWRQRFVRNPARLRARTSEIFSSVYFSRRLLAIAMIYFKSAAGKPAIK